MRPWRLGWLGVVAVLGCNTAGGEDASSTSSGSSGPASSSSLSSSAATSATSSASSAAGTSRVSSAFSGSSSATATSAMSAAASSTGTGSGGSTSTAAPSSGGGSSSAVSTGLSSGTSSSSALSGSSGGVPQGLLEEYRAAVTLQQDAYAPCVLGLPMQTVQPSTPILNDRHMTLAATAYADVVAMLGVFAGTAALDVDLTTLWFGPVALTGPFQTGFARGRVQRMDEGSTARWSFEVRAGPSLEVATMVTVLWGERRTLASGATNVDLTMLLRAGNTFTGGDGQVVLRQDVDAGQALGPWSSTAVVTAEWQPTTGNAPMLSMSATCGHQARSAGTLVLGASGFFRDENGDTFPDHTATLVVALAGTGGLATTNAHSGSTPGGTGSRLAECWDAAGSRVFVTATDGTNTVTDPPGGTGALCPPPFHQGVGTLALPDLDPAITLSRGTMMGRAYVNLHAPLVLPATPQRVLWVGAHPDDEAFQAAPILGALCRDLGGSCTFLVVTNGSTGSCRVPTGCPPDLGTWRTQEMLAAGAVYAATVDQWTWTPGQFPGDTMSVLDAWSTYVGNTQALVDAIAGVVETVQPDIIITMDPRHGLSCHAEHRVVSALTLAAVNATAVRPTIYLGQGWNFPPPAMDPTWLSYDATQPSAFTGTDTWDFIRRNLEAHPSQVFPDDVAAVAQQDPSLRRMWVLDATNLVANDMRYDYCPNR